MDERSFRSGSKSFAEHSPSSSTIENDGLFANIASYCDHPTLLRLCTLSRSDAEHRCELAMRFSVPEDTRRTKPVQGEGWITVLRERIALDRELATVDVGGGRIRICREEQVIREGIHRAVFVCQGPDSSYTLGAVKGECRLDSIDESGDNPPWHQFAAVQCIYLSAPIALWGQNNLPQNDEDAPKRFGVELNVTTGVMNVFSERDDNIWENTGLVQVVHKSNTYCWAGDVGLGFLDKGSLTIQRPVANESFAMGS